MASSDVAGDASPDDGDDAADESAFLSIVVDAFTALLEGGCKGCDVESEEEEGSRRDPLGAVGDNDMCLMECFRLLLLLFVIDVTSFSSRRVLLLDIP